MSTTINTGLGSIVHRFLPCLPRFKHSTTKHSSSLSSGAYNHRQQRVMAAAVGTMHGGAMATPPGTENIPGLVKTPWHTESVKQQFSKLDSDLTCDVCVIGGGIAGLSTAYNLVTAGKKVVLLEGRVIGSGQTGRTTAHIMTWWDDWYSYAESMHGPETTKLMADSMCKAVDMIEETIKKEGIDCDFLRTDGYLFPHEESAKKDLREEFDACLRAGMTDVMMVDLGGGPEVGGIREAILFPNNGEFHPLKYLNGLVKAIKKHGGEIYEMSQVEKTDEGIVKTVSDYTIRANAIVLATNSPINNNLAIHARQLPYRTYVVGLKIAKSDYKRSLYWDTDEPYQYIRVEELDDDNYVLIVGGGDKKSGFPPSDSPYVRLEKYARQRWSQAGELLYRWSGQVMEVSDALYIHGRAPPGSPRDQYVITGDHGQGVTGGTIGGRIIADLILSQPNPWAEIYDPCRNPAAKSLLEIAEEGAVTVASFGEYVVPRLKSKSDVGRGEGAVVQDGVHKVAVYTDEDGTQHAFSAVCPHLKCIVHWNAAEKTYDCPCHGSMFDRYGNVINGPATCGLSKYDEW